MASGRELGTGGQAVAAHVEAVDGEAVEVLFPQAPNRFRAGGPLRQVRVYRRPGHWHLVSFGLSELDDKESDDPSTSGWGYELTFRLAATDDEVPLWAVDFLTNLAAYVWRTRRNFAVGHHVDLRGPIQLGTTTSITAAVVTLDVELGVLEGPCGEVEFLQVVGITGPELEVCRQWSTDGLLELLARDDPLLVTSLERVSVTDRPALQAEIDQQMAGAGPAPDEMAVGTLRWSRRGLRRMPIVALGSGAATALGPALRRHLVSPGASFTVVGETVELRFVLGAAPSWSTEGGRLELVVTAEGLATLAALFDGRTGWGRSPEHPGVRFRVTA